MKSNSIDIGKYCSIGNMAVVLYGTRMDEGAVLGPLSVLMKGEALPRWSRWHGVPSQPAESTVVAQDNQPRKANRTRWRPSEASVSPHAGTAPVAAQFVRGKSERSARTRSRRFGERPQRSRYGRVTRLGD